MIKIWVILAFLGILFGGCKKKYTCWCHTDAMGLGRYTIEANKRKASKECEYYGDYVYQGITYHDVKCELTQK